MIDERATGIILRTRPLTETSLIVQWLSLEAGRISTVAKGARRPKSPFIGKLDLYYEADFSFQRARKSSLHTLREINLRKTHPTLRTDFVALEQAARAGRRIERTTEEDVAIPDVFALFQGFINELAVPPLEGSLLLAFEVKLLDTLGFAPVIEGSSLPIGSRRALEQLRAVDFSAVRRVKLSASQKIEIETFLDRSFVEAML
jgi:DNA repair protein RecO (recombination protein O)